MRYIAAQTGQPIRIVALGASMANARDIAEWIGASTQHTFNFHPMVRPVPLEVHLQSYAVSHFASLMLAMTRPVYQAILQSASTNRPTLVFVPSRKQCRLTAADLLMYAAADEEPDRFLGCEHDELKVHLAQVTDATLAGTLQHGIGYYHEALSDKDKRIVEQLYTAGALQVLVASKDTCWGMSLAAYLVIVMGTQSYLGREHRYVDYPMADVLQMMGRACRTGQDMGRCILMCQTAKKEFYKKFLHEALPIESHLDHFLHDHFNAEIVTRTIESKQDAVDWLTWTFLYRRMTRNPNYYGLQGVTHRHLSDHLSELVETTLNDLVTARCISVEEEDDEEITPLNLGMIAAYYNIHYATVEMFGASLKATSKLRGLLEIISAASEFESLPLRHHEVTVLQRLQDRLPVKLTAKRLDTPASKANLLLQAHFSRLELPADLAGDQRLILERVTPLLQACVDVISSQGWLAPALAAMELSQMCVQAQWDTESPLRQLPYFTQDHVKRCEQAGIELIFDVAELSDKKRNTLLQLNADQMRSVARFVNRYPSIEMEYQLDLGQDEEKKSGRTRVGQPGHCIIQLNREMDDEDATTVGPVIAPFFPKTKDEGWWLVMGDPSDQTLVAIKRVTLQRSLTVRLEFTPHRAGPLAYKLYFICDAYLGCDQEYDIELIADEALEETSSEEEEEEEEEDTEMKDVDE
jgi:pre-mRNA-splicing helicase BRR2